MSDLMKEYANFIPKGFTFNESGLFLKSKYFSSFLPVVESRVTTESDGELTPYVRLYCIFPNGDKSELITLPLSGMEDVDWFKHDPRCQINPALSGSKKHIASIISFEWLKVPETKGHVINNSGTYEVDNTHAYNTGGQLVWPASIVTKPEVITTQLPYRLVIDDDVSEKEAYIEMLRTISLSPDVGRIVFTYAILNIMRHVYSAIGVTPKFVVFVVGSSGNKKTSYIKVLIQLHDRDKGFEESIRLTASIPSAEIILSKKRDCTATLDDLTPSESTETRRSQERTLLELTRIISDNSGRAKMSGSKMVSRTPTCGLVVTGEYLIGKGSDAARMLPVELAAPIDNMGLRKCQQEPLMVSTFYNYFIQWFISNYCEIKELLEKWLDENRRGNMGIHARLQETFFCLDSAFKLFLSYGIEKGFASQADCKTAQKSFQTLLLALVKEQDKRARPTGDSESIGISYLRLVNMLYQGNDFRLAGDISRLKDNHHGLIYKNCLCLRGAKLLETIQKINPNAKINEIIESLKAQNALKVGNDKTTIQISGGGGKRFLAIPLKKLR